MTTLNGTLTSCGSGKWFHVDYVCVGADCSTLIGYPNITCTYYGSKYTCSNHVSCSAVSNYTTQFSFIKQRNTISHTQKITSMGCNYVLKSNGTTAGTRIVDNSCQSTGSRYSSKKALLFVLFTCLFIQGVIAQEAQLSRRINTAWFREVEDVVSNFQGYVLGKVENKISGEPVFADTFVGEVFQTLCGIVTDGLLEKALQTDFIEACAIGL